MYNQINTIDSTTVTSKGTPQGSKINCCKTKATRNKRKAAPKTLEIKKKAAPVPVKVKVNFKLGDQVRLFDGKAVGTIDSIEKEKAIVNYGMFTTQVRLEALDLVQAAKIKK